MTCILAASLVLIGLAAAKRAEAAPDPTSAAQALAAHRALTGIGPDPCRTPSQDEIVVCGRRESPYALPLYDPVVGDESVSGRERERAVETMQGGTASCPLRGEPCLKPLVIVRMGISSGKVRLATEEE